MTLAPLLAAPGVVQFHAVAAMSAFVLGLVQMAAPKGTLPHRALGWVWAGLMMAIAGSSFWITGESGRYSWIHVLSALTLVTVPLAVFAAMRGRVRAHRLAMIQLFLLALVLTGSFTLLPGRIMGRVVFG